MNTNIKNELRSTYMFYLYTEKYFDITGIQNELWGLVIYCGE